MGKKLSEKEQYLAYERIRVSGITNMFHISRVKILSGLTSDQIIFVMDNYKNLNERYGGMR